MKIEIFKTGQHTSSDGRVIDYKIEDLQDIANVYNDKTKLLSSFKAPLVLGHPKDDEPALGWVDSLEVIGEKLIANIDNVPNETKALLDKGYFKKVSISLYADRMLKHIGLLGAVTPAVKGLQNIQAENNYIEFTSVKSVESSQATNNNEEYRLIEENCNKLESKIQDLELKLYKYQIKEKLFKDTDKYNNEFSENILEPLLELQIGSNKSENIENILSNIYNFIENNQQKNISEFKDKNTNDLEFEDALFENSLENGLTTRLIDNIQNVNNFNNPNNHIEFETKDNINPEKLELHKFINEIANKNNITYTEAIDLIN